MARPAPANLAVRVLLTMSMALLGLAACTTDGEPEPADSLPRISTSASVEVHDNEPAELTSPDKNVTIEIPAEALSGEGTLSVRTASGPGGRDGWAIELNDGAQLTGDATLRFAAPTLDPDEPDPVVFYTEDSAWRHLVPVRSTLEGDELVVTTNHFSNWFVDRWEDVKKKILPAVLDSFDHLFSLSGEGKHPKCAQEAAVRKAGYKVTSDPGRRVYWCLGREDGHLALKATNSRGYGVAAEYTPGASVAAVDHGGVADWLLHMVDRPAPYFKGNKVELLAAGSPITFMLDEGRLAGERKVGVTFRADGQAYLVSAGWFAIETITMLLGRVGASSKTAGVLETFGQGASCLRAFDSMATTDIQTAVDAQGVLNDALTMSFDCMGAAVKDYDFGPILKYIVEPLLWLWSGILTAVNGVVAIGDQIIELFTDDVAGYTIYITGPPTPPTRQTVINPFTTTGLKTGWALDRSNADAAPVDCTYDQGSPYAVGPSTHRCGTTADSMNACWTAQFNTQELWCLNPFDPDSRELFARPAVNINDDTPTPADPEPLFLELQDGSRWWARTGGAWGGRADGWNPTYGCANDVGACAPSAREPDTALFILYPPTGESAVDTSQDTWTVHVGILGSDPTDPVPEPTTTSVRRAWFIDGHRWNGD